jgi:hypothetical protein
LLRGGGGVKERVRGKREWPRGSGARAGDGMVREHERERMRFVRADKSGMQFRD